MFWTGKDHSTAVPTCQALSVGLIYFSTKAYTRLWVSHQQSCCMYLGTPWIWLGLSLPQCGTAGASDPVVTEQKPWPPTCLVQNVWSQDKLYALNNKVPFFGGGGMDEVLGPLTPIREVWQEREKAYYHVDHVRIRAQRERKLTVTCVREMMMTHCQQLLLHPLLLFIVLVHTKQHLF